MQVDKRSIAKVKLRCLERRRDLCRVSLNLTRVEPRLFEGSS
jgi:hypothetical protein